MRKILIVDDSKTNRMILKAIVEDYCKSNDIYDIVTLDAENGQEAVHILMREHFDLIFMDIMMPVMDGIEATAKIREKDKKVMIIAVSALDDEENKSKILINGAEDYIVKPISEEVMKRRLTQYLELIELRKSKRFSSSSYNVMDSSIFSRRTTFFVDNELHLSEFWDFYLISGHKFSDGLSDLVKIIYGIGAWQLKLKYKFEIVVEESEQNLYFTIGNMNLLNSKVIESVISKNYAEGIYELKGDKLTFLLTKTVTEYHVKKPVTQFKEELLHEPKQVDVSKVEIKKSTEEIRVFDFIDGEDLEELESVAGELSSIMLLVGSSKLEESEIGTIAGYIEKFGKILSQYPETYNLYQAMTELSQDIAKNSQAFMEKSKDIAMLCSGFNNDLQMWIRKIFYEGAPSVDFLDNSIISNANMISTFIKPSENQAAELDDIFDF